MNVVYARDAKGIPAANNMARMNGIAAKRVKDNNIHFSKRTLGIFATGTNVFSDVKKNKIYL